MKNSVFAVFVLIIFCFGVVTVFFPVMEVLWLFLSLFMLLFNSSVL